MKTPWSLRTLLMCLCLLLVHCAGPQRRSSEGPSLGSQQVNTQRVEPEARTIFFQAERAFQSGELAKAKQGYGEVLKRFPNAKRASMISLYRLGSILYMEEDYENAARQFQRFLGKYPKTDLAFDVRYNLAAAEYQMGNYSKAYANLTEFSLQEIRGEGPRRADVVLQLVALSAEGAQNYSGAISAYAAQAQLPLGERKRQEILRRVDANLARISETSQLDRLLSDVTEATVRAKITQRMAMLAGRGSAPPVPGASTGEETPESLALNSGSSAERNHIGVILPLTGKFARYGQKALEGIILASQSFSPSRRFELQLFIEDSESNPAIAGQAVDKLFYKHRVSAIIGPFNWRESIAVADRAQQLGVLNISLTAKEGISSRGAYLFQNALTPKVQLESLVDYSIEKKNFRRFAIMAPDNAYGRDMANQFWDLVQQKGGIIVGYQAYPPAQKDFQSYVRELVGLADLSFRRTESRALEEYKTEQKEKTGRTPKAQMPPVIDFDAIFLPDSPATVAKIAASLAYYDSENVPLLGTVEWNSDILYRRGGRFVDGAIFPAGLSNKTSNPAQRNFIRLYSSAYGVAPDLLAAQGFEAMQFISEALSETSSTNRNSLVEELSRLSQFNTALGSVTFDRSRIAQRKLPIFRLNRGVIREEQL